jgi:hypothetical protein
MHPRHQSGDRIGGRFPAGAGIAIRNHNGPIDQEPVGAFVMDHCAMIRFVIGCVTGLIAVNPKIMMKKQADIALHIGAVGNFKTADEQVFGKVHRVDNLNIQP